MWDRGRGLRPANLAYRLWARSNDVPRRGLAMSIRIRCPNCQQEYTVNDLNAGKRTECKVCRQQMRVPAVGSQDDAPVRTEPADAKAPDPASAETIFLACPHCGHQKKAPARFAGQEAQCPKCDKFFVAPSLERSAERAPAPVAAPTPESAPMPMVEYRRSREVAEEDDDYDRPRRRRRRVRSRDDDRIGFRCPFCNTSELPLWREKISTAGWITFVLLLLVFCWPLCWIGLLMKDRRSVCARCGIELD
jgi:ribosomal protein S27E